MRLADADRVGLAALGLRVAHRVVVLRVQVALALRPVWRAQVLAWPLPRHLGPGRGALLARRVAAPAVDVRVQGLLGQAQLAVRWQYKWPAKMPMVVQSIRHHSLPPMAQCEVRVRRVALVARADALREPGVLQPGVVPWRQVPTVQPGLP